MLGKLTPLLNDTDEPVQQIRTALLLVRNGLEIDRAIAVLIGLLKNDSQMTWSELVEVFGGGSYSYSDPLPTVKLCSARA